LREPRRPAVSTLTGSESIALSLIATVAAIVVGAYLADRVGGAFTPWLALAVAVVVGACRMVSLGRSANWETAETATFLAIVAVTFGWLLWIARPTLFPLGSGPDLTHHLLLIHYIETHWTLVRDPAAQEFLGEMVQYTPGSHILTALAGAWVRSNGLHAMHAVMAASAALKASFVFLIAKRILPHESQRTPIAALASISLFASQIYFLGSFAQYSFLAQVVAESFAVAMWWTLTVWDQHHERWLMPYAGLLGAAVFLTWPILIGPPLVVLGILIVLRDAVRLKPGTTYVAKVIDASIAVAPIVIVAVLFSVGRMRYVEIAGTGGEAPIPMARAYGWIFLVLSSAGIVIGAANLPPSRPKGASAILALFAAAILLQAGGLYLFAHARGNDPYMTRKMFYMLLYPQAVGVALTVGTLWKGLPGRANHLRQGYGGPPKRFAKPEAGHYVRFAAVIPLVAAVFVARPLVGAPKSLLVGKHPATSLELEQAGTWVVDHVDPHCVEYLVGDDNTAYWLHLAVLGNPRRGARTGDNATYELTPALVRWLTPGGFPYAIADLRVVPSDIKADANLVAQFGSAAVMKREGPSSCPLNP